MTAPLPEVRALARSLLEKERTGDALADLLETTETLLDHLAKRITPLVGGGGFHLLLQRALKRAAGRHPWLVAIEIDKEAPGRLSGAADAAREVTTEDAAAAAEALLAELIGLLVRFLGADIALRLVRQSFPGVSGEEPGSGIEGDQR
jgi:hypothetical protein